jgi:hypothetical protein
MRGTDRQQSSMFSYISAEQRVPEDHPLRALRAMADAALTESRFNRPSLMSVALPLRRHGGGTSCTTNGLLPNFPPIISRVRRLFRPLLGRVVCGFVFNVHPSFSGRPSLFEGG